MKSITLYLTMFLALSLQAFAGGDGERTAISRKSCNIEGTVADINSGEMLVGALVEVVGTNLKAYTDFDGNFEIEDLKPGTYNLIVSYISYNKSYVENIVLSVGLDKKLQIALTR